MYHDPIVEEVWKAREKLWKAFGDDPNRVFDHIRESEQRHPERLIGPEEFTRRYKRADAESLPPAEADAAEPRRAS
ncbi:MAG TPA: hypothetical protein VF170_09425 [Planctomycetaceae bacterium]